VKAQFVLDASALLSMVLDERGHERVDRILDRSRIHAVNLAEVVGRLVRAGMPAESAIAILQELHLDVEEEFGATQAESCGALMGSRRDLGLSLGDCVCLTTAAWLGAVAVTADRRWKTLEGTVVNDETIRVELIRG
jgi:PIN domain nuclease of toxin-antitoxin system